MSKLKVLINDSIICSLSKTDDDNLKLLQACLPEEGKLELTDLEKEAVNRYNDFIDKIIDVNKGKAIMIDLKLHKRKL